LRPRPDDARRLDHEQVWLIWQAAAPGLSRRSQILLV
jgi:hypothetical protein